jgi:glyoxalase family protein
MIGIGTVHHIAFRTQSDENQKSVRKNIIKMGLNPTPIIDRTYFHSVYFREPGSILFEIATDPPGFTVDQKIEDLGKKLMLPGWLESVREKLEKVLPKIELSTNTKDNSKTTSDHQKK